MVIPNIQHGPQWFSPQDIISWHDSSFVAWWVCMTNSMWEKWGHFQGYIIKVCSFHLGSLSLSLLFPQYHLSGGNQLPFCENVPISHRKPQMMRTKPLLKFRQETESSPQSWACTQQQISSPITILRWLQSWWQVNCNLKSTPSKPPPRTWPLETLNKY